MLLYGMVQTQTQVNYMAQVKEKYVLLYGIDTSKLDVTVWYGIDTDKLDVTVLYGIDAGNRHTYTTIVIAWY